MVRGGPAVLTRFGCLANLPFGESAGTRSAQSGLHPGFRRVRACLVNDRVESGALPLCRPAALSTSRSVDQPLCRPAALSTFAQTRRRQACTVRPLLIRGSAGLQRLSAYPAPKSRICLRSDKHAASAALQDSSAEPLHKVALACCMTWIIRFPAVVFERTSNG